MESPSVATEIGDISVCLLSAKRKSASSPSLRQLDQMSLCDFTSTASVSDGLRQSTQVGHPRKRTRESDTQSVDLQLNEPEHKRVRRPLGNALANFLAESPFKSAKRTLKRSLSFKDKDQEPSPATKYKLPSTPKDGGSMRKRRMDSKASLPSNWVDAVQPDFQLRYTKEEIKRQEAIYAMFRTESEMVDDLKMIINIFFHPMLRLQLISEEDHCKIFGNIQTILSLHENLLQKFEELRSQGESIDAIGAIMLEWSHGLDAYAEYCANLVTAKHTFETTRVQPAVEDFLQRCLDSEFSRKIDLWTFLDSPRTRIMKYPILLKEVKKKTPTDHHDNEPLDQAITSFDTLIKEVDRRTGMAKCLDVISRLEYLQEEQKCPEIMKSSFILCSGVLKNKSGSKLQTFLTDKVLILTRPSSRCGVLNYQVYREPIPVHQLLVEDLGEGDGKTGSFRGTLNRGSSTGVKHLFRVSCTNEQANCHSHTLQANGDYDKKAWLDAFKNVVQAIILPSAVTTV
ncbi:hypothetical protein EMCRGX_G026404 [Ephydatia muelleri]|eukprot:Em0014g602a